MINNIEVRGYVVDRISRAKLALLESFKMKGLSEDEFNFYRRQAHGFRNSSDTFERPVQMEVFERVWFLFNSSSDEKSAWMRIIGPLSQDLYALSNLQSHYKKSLNISHELFLPDVRTLLLQDFLAQLSSSDEQVKEKFAGLIANVTERIDSTNAYEFQTKVNNGQI